MSAPDPVTAARDEGYALAQEHSEQAVLEALGERDKALAEVEQLRRALEKQEELARLNRQLRARRSAQLRETLAWITRMAATDSRDWSLARGDALLYAVLVGWNAALPDVAARHQWPPALVSQLHEYRAGYAAVVGASDQLSDSECARLYGMTRDADR